MHAAMLVTEYGDSPSSDPDILSGMTSAQQDSLSGSVFWTWKENCGTSQTPNCMNGWGVYEPPPSSKGVLTQNGNIYPSRQTYLQRAWPQYTSGNLLAYSYDPTAIAFAMDASSTSSVTVGNRSLETVIYLPPKLNGNVHVTGAASLDEVAAMPGGGRLAYVAPNGQGEYKVSSGSSLAAQSLSGQVDKAASSPIQPISEIQARQIFDNWVQGLSTSSDAKERSGATLITTLSGLILGTQSSDPNLAPASSKLGN